GRGSELQGAAQPGSARGGRGRGAAGSSRRAGPASPKASLGPACQRSHRCNMTSNRQPGTVRQPAVQEQPLEAARSGARAVAFIGGGTPWMEARSGGGGHNFREGGKPGGGRKERVNKRGGRGVRQ